MKGKVFKLEISARINFSNFHFYSALNTYFLNIYFVIHNRVSSLINIKTYLCV